MYGTPFRLQNWVVLNILCYNRATKRVFPTKNGIVPGEKFVAFENVAEEKSRSMRQITSSAPREFITKEEFPGSLDGEAGFSFMKVRDFAKE